MKQQVAFKIKGMTRDIAVSSFNAEYAFENKNIRFFTLEDNTAACISNEKGNAHIKISFGDTEVDYIAGVPIGNAVIDNKLILFTKDTKYDYIYKIWYEDGVLKGIVLAEQDLTFSVDHPIETLTYYENSDLQKVYWVDGINPPRCINIAEKDKSKWQDNPHYFDFINTLQLKEKVTVEKTFDQGGMFHSGVIQYACTYFNKYGQESNIFYTSPLLYISHQNRGGSPEDIVNNAFKITISNPDPNFDYIRIYSIFRSSINSTVEVKKVRDLNKKEGIYSSEISPLTGRNVDFKITDIKVTTAAGERHLTDADAEDGIQVSLNTGLGSYITCSVISFPDGSWMNVKNSAVGLLCKEGRVTQILPQDDTLTIYNVPYEDPFFIDTNTTGEIVDNSILLYIGGEDIIASTITQKDNTLFLGDIEIKRQLLPEEVINHFKHNKTITFSAGKELTPATLEGLYPYDSQLKYDASKIKTFKYLDWYRFGIQFQHETGKWSEPLWIDDVRNEIPIITDPYNDDEPLNLIQASYRLNEGSSEVITKLKNAGYTKARPVVVYPSINDREVVCQGVLCPTVYRSKDREEGIPYAQSSWFTRPNAPYDYDRTYNCPSTDTVYFRCKETLNSDNKMYGKDAVGKYIQLPSNWTEWALVLSQYTDPYTKDIWFICKINSDHKYFFRTPHYNTEEFTVYNSHNTEDPAGFTIALYNFQLLNGIDIRPIYGGDSGISRASVLDVGQQLITYDIEDKTQDGGSLTITPNKGSLSPNHTGAYAQYGLESRHGYSLPKNTKGNAEIQNASSESSIYDSYIALEEGYYIDQSIITLHSPEIEYDTTLHELDLSQLKLRIVGVVPITGNVRNIKVQTSTAPLAATASGAVARGFDSADGGIWPGGKELHHNAWHTLSAVACWNDYLYGASQRYNDIDFTVYPWHRNGSLNNTDHSEPDSTKSSLLKHKGISNCKYSYSSKYFKPQYIWNAKEDKRETKDYRTGIAGVALFNSDVVSVVKLPSPNNDTIPEITYYGNIDSIAAPYDEKGYPITFLDNLYWGDPADTPEVGDTFCKIITGINDATDNTPKTGLDGIAVKYKSSPHAVLALNYANKTTSGSIMGTEVTMPVQRILPTFTDKDNIDPWVVNPPKNSTVSQDVIDLIAAGANYKTSNVAQSINCGFLWLGELYRDNVLNRFGGTTEDALAHNQWIPCGEAVELNTEGTDIYWTEGDTYYQRYDHLKTLPFHPEDQNSIVDIISFMCETRINIDGRYDRNRGLENYLNVNKENFNKLNPIYSQQDNFFTYRSLDRERFDISHFKNSITWTKTKVAGELIDTWTNIIMANTLDLDGDKGKITALKRFNDNIIAFQDKGISQILYNEQTQISTTAGVPIEIANSNKITGRRYVSDRVGCQNKWSICETSQGIYFVDDYNKEIYKFTGELIPLSTSLGFKAWTVQNTKINNIWNPVEFNAITTQYDNKNKDVLFITKDECLAYSELYNTFTSYYSYEGTPYMINLSDKVLSLHKSLASNADSNYRLWCQQEGQYNRYFDKFNPYYISLIANPNPFIDKIFTNVEFRSDTWDENNHYLTNETFDTLIAKNEYQEGEVDFTQSPRELKKKFRIWRANIPRNTTNLGGDNLHNYSRDRMRNPWLYIKLAKQKKQYNRMILHDVVVSYYE